LNSEVPGSLRELPKFLWEVFCVLNEVLSGSRDLQKKCDKANGGRRDGEGIHGV